MEDIQDFSVTKHVNSKLEVIESILHQAIYSIRDLMTEFEQMHMQKESVKKQIIAQNEKCESKNCCGSEELKKVIQSKDNVIQSIASALTKLNETRNFDVLTDIFKILFGESKSPDSGIDIVLKEEINLDDKEIQQMSPISIEKGPQSVKNEPLDEDDMSVRKDDDSISEIEGTPTGRRSPIIQSKKLKSSTPITMGLRDKKKCPESWLTPEKKCLKQSLPTPTKSRGSTRLRQKRLNVVKLKSSNVVDLTTSPQFSLGRGSQDECLTNNIKQEMLDNDDTILPSPTSGPMYPSLYRTLSKESPQKFKKPLSLIRGKSEKATIIENIEPKASEVDITNVSQLEESVNLLKEYDNRFTSPIKSTCGKKSPINANESMSLIQQGDRVESKNLDKQLNSPTKRPLAENVNFGNVPCDSESSMSILRRDVKINKIDVLDENIKRTKSEILEPLYKEPTVRKKSEKRALPGWSCDECKNFYSELYKDNIEMLAKKMDECSKHRGRNNPVRPKTPPGFWNPRWDVPDDTEEFNRRNNAV